MHDPTSEFLQIRSRLLGVAQRIVGHRGEAEDIVQEAWIRWQRCDRDAVTDPTAFLVTATTRLALNAASSARVRREAYVGEWLPDPADPAALDPLLRIERGDALEQGLRVLHERLGSVERTAYVLRHAFELPYRHIAETLDLSEANARQLVSRAGRRLPAPV